MTKWGLNKGEDNDWDDEKPEWVPLIPNGVY